MKLTTTTTVAEGSPEELAEYQRRLGPNEAGVSPNALDAKPSPKNAPETTNVSAWMRRPVDFVDVQVARKMISRRPLSDQQKIVLKTLYGTPHLVPTAKLQDVTGYSARQMAGLMGAFGRRLTHTEGYEEGTSFFDWWWDENGWHYSLPDSVRHAMELEDVV